jgi:hypothetical protein
MTGRYKVYIVNILPFQPYKHFDKFRRCYLFAIAGLTDVIVLTKDAAQIATGKEDCTGTSATADDRLFARMHHHACDDRILGGFAKAQLFNPIRRAESWADCTSGCVVLKHNEILSTRKSASFKFWRVRIKV